MAVRFFHRLMQVDFLPFRSSTGSTSSMSRVFPTVQQPSLCRPLLLCCWRQLNTSVTCKTAQESEAKRPERTATVVHSTYNALMESAKQKPALEKQEQFALVLKEFMAREKYRRGHVHFIRLALHRMDEFGLEKDLLTYNRMLDIFPKGKFIARRMLDALWPRSLPQLELALELLTKMEEHGVRPDYNTFMLLTEIFGRRSLPAQKCIRIAYWFDAFEHADPYKVDGELPSDPLELSRLALKRITGDRGQLTEHKVTPQDNGSSCYIISGSTLSQLHLLESLGSRDLHGEGPLLLHVEGPHLLWMLRNQQFYYSVRLGRRRRGDEGTKMTEEEEEGSVLGVCVCHPPTQDSLKLWLGALQETYPILTNAVVVYNIREPSASKTQHRQLQDGHVTTIAEAASV